MRGVILDDHQPRRLRLGRTASVLAALPAREDVPGRQRRRGYVRALIRSDNGGEHTRLMEVTATEDGVSYHVVAERPDCDLDEFAVSDDLSTVALLWNMQGAANYRSWSTPTTRWPSRSRCLAWSPAS